MVWACTSVPSETTLIAFARSVSELSTHIMPSLLRAAPTEYRSRSARYMVGTERSVRPTMSVTVPGSARLQNTRSLDPLSMTPRLCRSEALLSSSVTASLCGTSVLPAFLISPLSSSLLAAALAWRCLGFGTPPVSSPRACRRSLFAECSAASDAPTPARTTSSRARSSLFIDYHYLTFLYKNLRFFDNHIPRSGSRPPYRSLAARSMRNALGWCRLVARSADANAGAVRQQSRPIDII